MEDTPIFREGSGTRREPVCSQCGRMHTTDNHDRYSARKTVGSGYNGTYEHLEADIQDTLKNSRR